jgi:acetyltransferase-like isoleucine patch superfamily enzyme
MPGTSIVLGSLRAGPGVFVNRDCLLEASAGIDIGQGTAIGPNVTILTLTHDISGGYPRAGKLRAEPVSIGREVWIGASATILPGAMIGDGCVIAAGALVRGQLARDGLYAGVPARRIRDLPDPRLDD